MGCGLTGLMGFGFQTNPIGLMGSGSHPNPIKTAAAAAATAVAALHHDQASQLCWPPARKGRKRREGAAAVAARLRGQAQGSSAALFSLSLLVSLSNWVKPNNPKTRPDNP